MKKLKKTRKEFLNLKPYINNYNWKDIEFPSHLKGWKKFDQNINTIALNILFVPCNTKQIRPAYISKYNNKRVNQVNLLMITDNEKWHYLAVKSILGLEIWRSRLGFLMFKLLSFVRNRKKNLKTMKRHAKIMISVM